MREWSYPDPPGTINYRSPFDDNTDYSYGPGLYPRNKQAHYNWVLNREQYVTTGDPKYLSYMLTNVTMDNPPDALTPVFSQHDLRQGYPNIMPYIVICVLGPILAGLFGGFEACTALVVILFCIFVISWLNYVHA
jgi:hypothetical protein